MILHLLKLFRTQDITSVSKQSFRCWSDIGNFCQVELFLSKIHHHSSNLLYDNSSRSNIGRKRVNLSTLLGGHRSSCGNGVKPGERISRESSLGHLDRGHLGPDPACDFTLDRLFPEASPSLPNSSCCFVVGAELNRPIFLSTPCSWGVKKIASKKMLFVVVTFFCVLTLQKMCARCY